MKPRMLTKKENIFFAILFFTCESSIAQQKSENIEDRFRVIHWTVNEGLAHDQVTCIHKDAFGFLWIGTPNGLSRFDGSTFKNYFYNPRNRQTIVGPTIWGLVEDSLHNIWIGTDKGLSRYDRKADTLSNFLPSVKTPTFSTFIIPFWATKDEIFCQETDSFITSFNVHTLSRRTMAKLTAADSVTNDHYSTQNFIFDKTSNSIWLRRDLRTAGLLQIFLSTQKRACYGVPNGESMCYDAGRNSIWTNTDNGLIEFSLNDKKVRQATSLQELAKRNVTGHIGVRVDAAGKVWFYTFSRGILIYDPADESVISVFEKDSVSRKNVGEANSYIYCDRDGIIWTGAWLRRGLYEIIPFSQAVESYNVELASARGLKTNNIINVISGPQGEMWMGTGDDLVIYDINRNRFESLHEKDLPGLKGKFVVPIFVDTANKKAWLRVEFPTSFYEMDIETRRCRRIVFEDSSGQKILPEFLDYIPVHYKNGFIIAANYKNLQVIFIVNSGSAVARQVFSFPRGTFKYDMLNFGIINPTPVNDRFLFLRTADPLGNLTYENRGNAWAKTRSSMDSIPWATIVYNKADKSYWVVALRELFHYDEDFQLIKNYSIENGLPHDQIYGLIADNNGNIWFNTYRSIYQLNARTDQIAVISERDGMQSIDLRDLGEGIAKDGNGNLYFTTAGIFNGFKRINPDRFVSPQSYSYIKSLEIREFALPLSTGPNSVQQLSLKYFQNRINVETGTIDHYSQGKNHIRYKLEREGRKEGWQYAPANYTIRYEELSPGSYSLQIQASNAANEFIGPMKTLIFQIHPAFWNTWWFRIVAVAFVFGIFYVFVRYRTQQKFRLQLERTGKEKQIAELGRRTAELQQQKIEMEMQALRAQMNPHFIFNSLNSINRFILQNERAQASEYLTKFSKLVRMILQNSQASLITLEAELESLELYLEMEALRFNYHFDYKISVSKDLDVEVLQVPPLILQPYVENAIWHGLMHKEEKGHLNIEILEKEDQLYFSIIDDGIGRQKAKELASKTATKHKSMGLRITANRIAILQKNGSHQSPVTINDLVNDNGSASGTEVIIKMPLIYD